MDNAPKMFKSRRLPKQVKGGMPIMIRRSIANLVLAVCESFLNLRVMINKNDGTQEEADVKQTELGTVITIPATAGAVSTTTGSSVTQFKIVSDGGDYWNCKTWDGSTLGSTEVKVAKPYKLRCDTGAITSETIRGQAQSYTYALQGGQYVRTVTSGGVMLERDIIIPDPLENDIIYAANGFSTATPSTLADVTYLDLNVDGRTWAEI